MKLSLISVACFVIIGCGDGDEVYEAPTDEWEKPQYIFKPRKEENNPEEIFHEYYFCTKPIEEIVVQVDPAINRAAFLDAWNEWQGVLKGKYPVKLEFPDTISPRYETCKVKILSHNHPNSAWIGWAWGWGDGKKPWTYRIWVSKNLSDNDVRKVVLHEVGHLIGFDHNFVKGSIMSPGPLQEHLSDYDKWSACKIYKCQYLEPMNKL